MASGAGREEINLIYDTDIYTFILYTEYNIVLHTLLYMSLNTCVVGMVSFFGVTKSISAQNIATVPSVMYEGEGHRFDLYTDIIAVLTYIRRDDKQYR